jgi:hypothetical protein
MEGFKYALESDSGVMILHTKSHKGRLKHSKVREEITETNRQHGDHIN